MSAAKADLAMDAAEQLESLAENLAGRGFEAQVIQDDGLAGLSVVHRSVPQLSEEVFAAPTRDGEWWLWWSWGDRLVPITAVETAALKIAYVLTPYPG